MNTSPYPYFGFQAPSLSQTGASYAANPMASGTVGMGTLYGMSNPMIQMAANGGMQPGQSGAASTSGAGGMSLPMQMMLMQQLGQMGGRTNVPQSTLGSVASALPALGLMAQSGAGQQGLSKLGGLFGGGA